MILVVGVAAAVCFVPFLGLMFLPAGRPAMIGICLAGACVLLLPLLAKAPQDGPLVLLVLGVQVALAAAGQALLLRPGTRRVPLIVAGLCLISVLILILVLIGTS